jgi:hypothetical protein
MLGRDFAALSQPLGGIAEDVLDDRVEAPHADARPVKAYAPMAADKG